ncbi:gamma-glutamyltranspeptidase [Talaromyces proteolyticus]|uniref:Gamma-glutamyltranspeptidase n=1 Tax=Talaromyces proteolyticus TaxID=1131652 RepID=A0AAD4KN95_9EURO|nr:gamma-glutamyltranspeptidase [Talaromyces proteolyticus]KAH8694160.1 gamma-glutamyltranspeptidase [Talaromyces proteolyticus]
MSSSQSVYRTASSLATASSFPSRRSVVHSLHGIVACTQPLAAAAGQQILSKGGNAADAAVAVAAALNVTEPGSTGIGGDMFCLYYDSATRQVHALNGSGRSPASITLDAVRRKLGVSPDATDGAIPITNICSVTVPGAAAGWVDTVEKFGSGKLSMNEILQPAIELAEGGFPVSEISSWMWQNSEDIILKGSSLAAAKDYLIADRDQLRAPQPGEIIKNPHLAETFKLLAKHGKDGFYSGRIADSIINTVQSRGGFLRHEDLQHHLKTGSHDVEALSMEVNTGILQNSNSGMPPEAVRLWEHPPNGQGIVALMATGILQTLVRNGQLNPFLPSDHNSIRYLHALIESLRIAFTDAKWWVTDPEHTTPPAELLSDSYLASKAELFSNDSRVSNLEPLRHSPAYRACDTAYFAVTDRQGNGISFINSLYGNFGSGIIPEDTGFILQGRGASFSLNPNHPNVVAPRKRPYHTIIPAITTVLDKDGKQRLHSVYGVMGGFMQPQGHIQVLLNQLLFQFTPQVALDAPRICVGGSLPPQPGETQLEDFDPSDTVFLEEGIPENVVEGLQKLGHRVHIIEGDWGKREVFGRGQVIRAHVDYRHGKTVFSAGSDPRGDGGAFPM